MSLKNALLKAGIKTTKTENMRDIKPKKEKKQIEQHQELRSFCEVCEMVQPDVERFFHKMPAIDAEWICVNCADKCKIHDDTRQTQQSHLSKMKQYKRFYGPTKKFDNKPTDKKVSTSNQSNKEEKKNYTIDDDGEKNFNR
ncbi:MAG: hypothetical protein JNM93_14435 [Bacteriovoracaceae bacterium]|nr:hypothetical protein [Bacteriovoracaceae bacterium]